MSISYIKSLGTATTKQKHSQRLSSKHTGKGLQALREEKENYTMEKKEHTYQCKEVLPLEAGGTLHGFQLHFTTLGKLNKEKTNVVWVCHALTGSSDFTSWWKPLFDKEGPFNPEKYFIICANMLGGCYGSTGPLSVNPSTGTPFYHDFPTLTNRDVANAFDRLRQHLGFEKIHTLLGGSLGGQQALEWAITCPDVFENLIAIACNAWHSPWGIALNEAQRMAIEADPTWKQPTNANAGAEGLKAARAIGMISYRHYTAFEKTQSEVSPDKIHDFRAASYQRYQGEKLVNRFNAFSYWHLSRLMDGHQVGRNRGGAAAALKNISARTLVIGIDSDVLFPLHEQQYLADHIPNARLGTVTSDYGHDGFLVEFEQINTIIKHHYTNAKNSALPL